VELSEHRITPRARKGKLRLGRIDPNNSGRCTPLDQSFGESAIAATNVYPSQSWTRRQPTKKDIPNQSAPCSHHALIDRAIIEAELTLGHCPSGWTAATLVPQWSYYNRKSLALSKLAGRLAKTGRAFGHAKPNLRTINVLNQRP
jgi:hypothetical protein